MIAQAKCLFSRAVPGRSVHVPGRQSRGRDSKRLLIFVPVLLGIAGCDGATRPDAHLIGTYVLRMYRGWPLPYFDYRTQITRSGGTLELQRGSRFEKLDSTFHGVDVTVGTFLPRKDRIALVSDDGLVESYAASDGILTSEGAVYIRAGRAIPPEYRWKLYGLDTCDGREPVHLNPCPGAVSGSSIWLMDNGRYYIADSGPGATSRREGPYHLDSQEIVLIGMSSERNMGTLRADTLTLGTWIYLRVE